MAGSARTTKQIVIHCQVELQCADQFPPVISRHQHRSYVYVLFSSPPPFPFSFPFPLSAWEYRANAQLWHCAVTPSYPSSWDVNSVPHPLALLPAAHSACAGGGLKGGSVRCVPKVMQKAMAKGSARVQDG